jgi:cysteine synthase A
MSRRLLFVEANTTGSGMAALRVAQRMGLEPVFLTSDPDRYLGVADTGARVVISDTASAGQLRRDIDELADTEIAGVTTTSEFYLVTVAELAASLSLPGNPPQVLRLCRNKALVRGTLKAFGIAQPRYVEVSSPEEVAAALSHTGLPCVVKPVDDSGSNNVRVCCTEQEAAEQVAVVCSTLTNIRGQRMAAMALIEEYVAGPEFSVEMFTIDGESHGIGVTQKTVSEPPFCVETGHLFPADIDQGVSIGLVETAKAVLKATGMRHGPSHIEMKSGPCGPVVIELNCRLAGGMIPELIRLATGADLLEYQLRCAMGESLDRAAEVCASQRWAGIRFLTATSAGILREVTGVERARAVPGVTEVTIRTAPGARVGLPRNAYDRLGFAVAAAESAAKVAQALAAVDLVQVVLS